MYSSISANKRRTGVLIAIAVAIILLLGYAYEQLLARGAGGGAILFALAIAVILPLVSYYRGDRVALWTSGARPTSKREHPEFVRTVENLAIAAGIPTPATYVIPDPAINAFATGRDPAHASVAVTTGALERLGPQELEGVLAHELSHVKNYDIRTMTVVVVLVGTIALLGDLLLRARMFGGSDREDRHGGQLAGILMVGGIILALLAPLIGELIKLAVSRRREFLADADGALLTRYPEGLARALERIAAHGRPLARANTATAHLFIANPFGNRRRWFQSLFSTHPPLHQRIAALRAMAM